MPQSKTSGSFTFVGNSEYNKSNVPWVSQKKYSKIEFVCYFLFVYKRTRGYGNAIDVVLSYSWTEGKNE